jgi:hypothetical protein
MSIPAPGNREILNTNFTKQISVVYVAELSGNFSMRFGTFMASSAQVVCRSGVEGCDGELCRQHCE